jgi:hypothetical protein
LFDIVRRVIKNLALYLLGHVAAILVGCGAAKISKTKEQFMLSIVIIDPTEQKS